jgi:hypothetical protein
MSVVRKGDNGEKVMKEELGDGLDIEERRAWVIKASAGVVPVDQIQRYRLVDQDRVRSEIAVLVSWLGDVIPAHGDERDNDQQEDNACDQPRRVVDAGWLARAIDIPKAGMRGHVNPRQG